MPGLPRPEDLPVRERHTPPGWVVAVRSDLGLVRRRLEDAWCVLPGVHLGGRPVDAFAVFDGLGGVAFGQEAAWAAAENLQDALGRSAQVEDVLGRLNQPVLDTSGATTGVVAIFPSGSGTGHVISAGDSAAYALDGQEAKLLTAKDSDGPYTVTDYLGREAVAGHVVPVTVPRGGTLLLCTDGVDGVAEPPAMRRLLSAPDLSAGLEDLFAEILERGAPDNATAVAIRRMK